MNKTIIHIGLHKTGTTFLQELVWPNLSNYTCITRPFTQHNHAFNKLQYADSSLYDKSEVQEVMKNFDTKNLILSDESFTGKPIMFSYINRSLIASRLHELFPDAEIILFIRDQKDIILSQYSSYIRMPYGIKKPEEFFYRSTLDYTYDDYKKHPELFNGDTLYYNTNDILMNLDCFKYSYLIKLYQSLFPKLHVILYEELKANPENVLEQLSSIAGQNIQVDAKRKVNAALTYKEIEKIRRGNQLSYTFTNPYIKKIGRVIAKTMPVFHKENLKHTINNHVGDFYKNDNLALKNLLPSKNWQQYSKKYC